MMGAGPRLIADDEAVFSLLELEAQEPPRTVPRSCGSRKPLEDRCPDVNTDDRPIEPAQDLVTLSRREWFGRLRKDARQFGHELVVRDLRNEHRVAVVPVPELRRVEADRPSPARKPLECRQLEPLEAP